MQGHSAAWMPPGTIIGRHRDGRPIHLIAGGAEDEPDDGGGLDVELDGPAEAGGEDAGAGAAATPSAAEKELAAVKAALAKANKQALTARQRMKAAEDKVAAAEQAREDALAAGAKAGEGADDAAREAASAAASAKAAREAAKEAAAAVENRYRPMVLNKAAEAALAGAGITSGAGRLVKLIDFSAVDIDEAGEVIGMDDQVEALKADFPDLFGAPKPARAGAGGVNAADRGRSKASEKPKSSAQMLASRALEGR